MILGIDAGNKFLKIVRLNGTADISFNYKEHHGKPEAILSSIIEESKIDISQVIFTGYFTDFFSSVFNDITVIDEITSIIAGAKYLKVDCRYLVNVGASSMKLIQLNEQGNFLSYKFNTLCAAGTGSFLDEQMYRMGLTYDAIAGYGIDEAPPDIATRCAVFAKTDLIHKQQEGYTKPQLWSGLCKGVVTTMLQSIFKGDIPSENILFSGGIFLNHHVRAWLKNFIPNAYFHEQGHFMAAIGSIQSYKDGNISKTAVHNNHRNTCENCGHALRINISRTPVYRGHAEYISDGNEVRIHKDTKIETDAALGIDIGSTSTKLVLVDTRSNNILLDIYRKTEGNPILASRKLFIELKNIIDDKSISITACGTTGSGRKLIGNIIGADVVANEITSHFKGAFHIDKSIETIFEIGGQDSKYIRGMNGFVVDCNMNFICAAGTGSFIEEQAHRLGFNINEIGDIVHGLMTPYTSDRCTVFMEQDINKLLRDGYPREEVLAGVIRSIAKNYLNKVVGTRPVTGNKIFFQGATARNKGLVAAFEFLLNKEIVVSPHCHAMGAFGAALISIEEKKNKGKFKGIETLCKNIQIDYHNCEKCENHCKITYARFDDGKVESWGYLCGNEGTERKNEIKSHNHFTTVESQLIISSQSPVQKRGKSLTLGIPYTLSMYNYLPLWKTFLEYLGINAVVSEKSDSTIKEMGINISKSDFCFPVKIGLAHIKTLSNRKDIDAIFLPTIISEKKQSNKLPRVFCPYVISFASVARETLDLKKDILSPAVDFRLRDDAIVKDIHSSLARFDISLHDIKDAYMKAKSNLLSYQRQRFETGSKILDEISKNKQIGIVFLGRPYTLHDNILNLNLPVRFLNKKVAIFPYEILIDEQQNGNICHTYWNYSEKILNAAHKIKRMDNIYPVYLTNYACGPDSFTLSTFEQIMSGKPYLIIELDDHSSATGYITRIEAFLDVILGKTGFNGNIEIARDERKYINTWKSADKKKKKLWIPSMHATGSRFMAAAFRAWGYDAAPLPPEDIQAYEIGKQTVRGSECLPAIVTIGNFLKKMRESVPSGKEVTAKPADNALFMPTAEGPCRFGQYSVLHRNILDKNGFGETEIFSPSSINSYKGLSGSLWSYIWDAILCADILEKAICKIRPYEKNSGETDLIAEESFSELEKHIEKKVDTIGSLKDSLDKLHRVPINYKKKPLVGIVGEIYIRCNRFCNNDLIRTIESNGGEAWLSPLSEWLFYTIWLNRYFTFCDGGTLIRKLVQHIKTEYTFRRSKMFEKLEESYSSYRPEPDIQDILNKGKQYLPLRFEGEAILTLGRASIFLENGADMVVNCAPFGCMPGNISASLFYNINERYKKPVITLFYDGESDVNQVIKPYLNNIKIK